MAWAGTPIEVLSPQQALLTLEARDVALARLGVGEDLAGVEDGLSPLERLAEAGVRVRNPPAALLRAHDKLLTARALRAAGLPHPRTKLVERGAELPDLDYPIVLEPRFGSRGKDVALSQPRRARAGAARACRTALVSRRWRDRSGADPAARLRLAADRRRGHGRRRRAPNRGSGRVADERGPRATVAPVSPAPVAVRLALEAAAASGLDLVGVDLLPTGPGGFCVLELNGAVDFRPVYAFGAGDAYADAAAALAGISASREPARLAGVHA